MFAVPPGYSGLRGHVRGVCSDYAREGVGIENCAFRDETFLPPNADDARFPPWIRGNMFIMSRLDTRQM